MGAWHQAAAVFSPSTDHTAHTQHRSALIINIIIETVLLGTIPIAVCGTVGATAEHVAVHPPRAAHRQQAASRPRGVITYTADRANPHAMPMDAWPHEHDPFDNRRIDDKRVYKTDDMLPYALNARRGASPHTHGHAQTMLSHKAQGHTTPNSRRSGHEVLSQALPYPIG